MDMAGQWAGGAGVFWLVLGLAGLTAGLISYVRCRRQMGRLEEMMANFLAEGKDWRKEKKPDAGISKTGERRESKLAHQLGLILDRAAFQKEQAAGERDQVAGLLSDLSHQLKTPLANIVMYIELLEEENLSREQERSFLEETARQARKMQWLIKAMLKASRLEHGIIRVNPGYGGIRETIGKAVTSVYAQAARRNISIKVQEFTDCRLYHDPVWTAEALGNILENGIKYAPEGSALTVRLNPMEIYTGIEIEDQGPGIPKEEYNEIFKRFYRGKGSSGQEGNGLGLYLAQLVLNKEKGYVTVKAADTGGSCFTVYLLNEVTGSSD